MTSEQRYLKQREWIDFCVRRQNLLQKTMKRVWTWIENDRSWQNIHKIFEEFKKKLFRSDIHCSTDSRHEANDEKDYVAYRNYLKI
jgi:hypothetical protein